MTNDVMNPETTIYLGDGAYAQFTGYSVIIFTHNGIHTGNEIEVEIDGLKKLIEFVNTKSGKKL